MNIYAGIALIALAAIAAVVVLYLLVYWIIAETNREAKATLEAQLKEAAKEKLIADAEMLMAVKALISEAKTASEIELIHKMLHRK